MAGCGVRARGAGLEAGAPKAAGRKRRHPFLLVRKDQYEELRGRALRSPWKEMKAAAIELAGKPIPRNRWNTCMLLRNVVSAATLAYVLDGDNRDLYKARILEGVVARKKSLGF